MKKFGFILAILSVLTFGFISNSSVYAEELPDIVVTVDQSSPVTILCSIDNAYTSCSGYHYMKIEYIGEQTGYTSQKYWRIRRTGFSSPSDMTFYPAYSTQTYYIPFNDVEYLAYKNGGANMPSTYSIKFTLSASPFADCPEPDPCPECEDCDEPFIVRLFQQGFWGVATAVVSLIVPIVALFLVFRLVHDFFWGRG